MSGATGGGAGTSHLNSACKTSPWVTALAYVQNMWDKDRTSFDMVELKARGFTAIGIFLFFGATMASLAAITLLWRGTALDGVWALNPTAYKELTPLEIHPRTGVFP
jgi:hypothetical protein